MSKKKLKTFSAVFLATLTIGFVVLALPSLYANPWGNYGAKGMFHLYNDRLSKATYLENLNKGEIPPALIMGSSGSLCYSSKAVENVFGLKAFNFGVFWGGVEEFFTILEFLRKDLATDPELIIIGLDSWSLGENSQVHPVFPGLRRRFINTPQLFKHYRPGSFASTYWAGFVDLFSPYQFLSSLKLLKDGHQRETQSPLQESTLFRLDGSRARIQDKYGHIEGDILNLANNGEFPISDFLTELVEKDTGLQEIPYQHYDFKRLSQARIELLDKLLTISDGTQTKIAIVVNPLHPIFLKVLEQNTNHKNNMEKLLVSLDSLSRKHSSLVTVFDASRIDSYGGYKNHFYDSVHAAEPLCNLILRNLKSVM